MFQILALDEGGSPKTVDTRHFASHKLCTLNYISKLE
jgi:hypothetical protein